jgi:restriction endonuclease Mrr
MRWIDDRRDPRLEAKQAARHAPRSWMRWVKDGRAAIPRVRRRVVSSRVRTAQEQLPAAGSDEAVLLQVLYEFFDGRKHTFELLAARVAAQVLGHSGARYHEGWLTRPGGDGGVDFVGRLDVGTAANNTPLVILGQAKCVNPTSSIGADQVARVVARLRRGWIGVFVTTGTFSKQAQIEVIDDQYPLVLVDGKTLAEQVLRMAAADHDGDLDVLLASVTSDYGVAITYRRPDEILLG